MFIIGALPSLLRFLLLFLDAQFFLFSHIQALFCKMGGAGYPVYTGLDHSLLPERMVPQCVVYVAKWNRQDEWRALIWGANDQANDQVCGAASRRECRRHR